MATRPGAPDDPARGPDNIAGYIQGLLDGVAFSHISYALDRDSRKASLAHFLGKPHPAEGAAECGAA